MEANQQPPPGGNTSNATPGLIGVSFLFAVGLAVYGVRMYARSRAVVKLAIPDYLVSAGLFCEFIVLSILLATLHLGLAKHDYYISQFARTKIMHLLFYLGLVGFWASSFARMSIGSMLLSFPISKAWRVTVWVLLVIQTAMPIGADVFQLLQCRPIRAMWEQVPDAVCWSAGVSQSYGYIFAGSVLFDTQDEEAANFREALGVLSDLVFAILPVHLFWPLHRPATERVLIIVLMGFGTVAAVAGGMKIYHISAWNPRYAILRDWVPLLWWYRVEEIGLIIAACAPFLKPLLERVLHRFGASQCRFLTIGLNSVRSDREDISMEDEATIHSKH
ncbi:hypothetical protein K458DRAFT_391817 [Lentithecium fluviatile CBS 122367]|uniref:Rhodopsin domain-containing protein n=1 Tax=Lentithecium fluviatile CBS 122367 TaxID=1168545 RepID=A0A6G1ITX3_9PLEO|nr:hypothetical protein K458DRAFT_391817 [Lentithecium fluviatile CBS 122367]